MKLHALLSNLQSQFSQLLLPQKPLAEIAIAEGLDEFAELESQKAEVIEYSTVHGCRVHSSVRPELNMFVVLKKGNGFIPARGLPYVYRTHLTSFAGMK